jgi:hypothetical protein
MLTILRPAAAFAADREVAAGRPDQGERCAVFPERKRTVLDSGQPKVTASSCMQKPRRMRHQHGVQRVARAISRARRPQIGPSFLVHSGDVLDQRRALARAQGALLPGG